MMSIWSSCYRCNYCLFFSRNNCDRQCDDSENRGSLGWESVSIVLKKKITKPIDFYQNERIQFNSLWTLKCSNPKNSWPQCKLIRRPGCNTGICVLENDKTFFVSLPKRSERTSDLHQLHVKEQNSSKALNPVVGGYEGLSLLWSCHFFLNIATHFMDA